MIVRVKGKHDYAGLWTYEKFREHHKAKLIEYNNEGNLILSIIYQMEGIVDDNFMEEHGLTYEIIQPKPPKK